MTNRRSLITLAASQALGLSAAPLVVMVGGVVGRELAPSPALATLPLATMVVGTALASAPAAMLMQRIGRRRGFILGAATGALGGAVGAGAIIAGSFVALSCATLLIGAHLAFVMQYRFAAAELAGTAGQAGAVAFVLAGGIAAGLLGPDLGRRGRMTLPAEWAGSFAAIAVLGVVLALLLWLGLQHDGPERVAAARPVRAEGSVRNPIRDPAFLFAATAGMTSYAVMTLVMTATPLAMHGAGYDVEASALVIQAHVVAMYAPSLIAGALVTRLGLNRLMAIGVVAMAACAGLGLTGRGLLSWVASLTLLGIGWNMLFLGGTVALAQAFPGAHRFRAQALNDVLVFGTQAVASLGAGALLAVGGWRAVNLVALAPLAAMSISIAVRARSARPLPARAGTMR